MTVFRIKIGSPEGVPPLAIRFIENFGVVICRSTPKYFYNARSLTGELFHCFSNGLSVSFFSSGNSIPPTEFPRITIGRYAADCVKLPERNM